MSNGPSSARRPSGTTWTSPPFQIQIESGPAYVCIKLGGELDIYTAPDLAEAIEKLEATMPALLIGPTSSLAGAHVRNHPDRELAAHGPVSVKNRGERGF
jgi:hypothetical protein